MHFMSKGKHVNEYILLMPHKQPLIINLQKSGFLLL